jgi:hypothetical protein
MCCVVTKKITADTEVLTATIISAMTLELPANFSIGGGGTTLIALMMGAITCETSVNL